MIIIENIFNQFMKALNILATILSIMSKIKNNTASLLV